MVVTVTAAKTLLSAGIPAHDRLSVPSSSPPTKAAETDTSSFDVGLPVGAGCYQVRSSTKSTLTSKNAEAQPDSVYNARFPGSYQREPVPS